MADYNYTGFSADDYNLDSYHGPALGQKAPDFTLETLSGEKRQLLDFDGEFLVLELGSITCPLFQSRRKGMQSLQQKFPNVSFAILYVREAHPGSSIPAHKTLADKKQRATQLRDADGETRDILLDGFDGAAHQALGAYPNSVLILNKNGCVVFHSAWNNAGATAKVLTKLVAGKPVRAESFFIPPIPPRRNQHVPSGGQGLCF
ncbi:MAG: deiodinase-like protein [Paracoccaceae bacterium]